MGKRKFEQETIKDYKPDIFVFDLDGCIVDSDDYVLTKEEAYKKDIEMSKETGEPVTIPKPESKTEAKQFSIDYLKKHILEIPPYQGMFSLFVKMAMVSNVAIVTSRWETLKAGTVEWLRQNIIKTFGEETWRRVQYKTFFNEHKMPSLTYKSNVLLDLSENYNIRLLIDDHPEVVEWAKKKGIETLVPSTGYKDLDGTDIEKPKGKTNDKLQQKRKKS